MACRSIYKWFTRNLFLKKQSHIKFVQHRHFADFFYNEELFVNPKCYSLR